MKFGLHVLRYLLSPAQRSWRGIYKWVPSVRAASIVPGA